MRHSRELAFVKRVGNELANFGTEPPRLVQKHAQRLGNDRVVLKQVLQRRTPCLTRMRPLNGLTQLPLIAKQNQVFCSPRHRQKVRQRHLTRLVHHQHIESPHQLGPSKAPSGCTHQLHTGLKVGRDARRCAVANRRLLGEKRLLRIGVHLHRIQFHAGFIRRTRAGEHQVLYGLVRIRRDPHSFSVAQRRQDHARTSVGFPSTRRSLNAQGSAIEFRNQPNGLLRSRFIGLPPLRHAMGESNRIPAQELLNRGGHRPCGVPTLNLFEHRPLQQGVEARLFRHQRHKTRWPIAANVNQRLLGELDHRPPLGRIHAFNGDAPANVWVGLRNRLFRPGAHFGLLVSRVVVPHAP